MKTSAVRLRRFFYVVGFLRSFAFASIYDGLVKWSEAISSYEGIDASHVGFASPDKNRDRKDV
jgi:hypothetical protein